MNLDHNSKTMPWRDYAITHVRYDDDETRIVEVRRWKVEEQLTNRETVSRKKVVRDIDYRGVEYNTAIQTDEGTWTPGDDVHVYEIDGEKFIRTEPSDTPEDNLGGLPTF